MKNKKPSNEKNTTRTAVLIGAAIGAFLTPIAFFLISLGTEFTSEKIMWLCINGLCFGVLLGGGMGYILTSKYVSF
jgi:hypothetical protein